jgi:aldehyde dehydrogenase (NAD+)
MTTTAEHTDLDRIRFYIDGEWVDPRGSDTHRALEAATGEPLGTAALATEADIWRGRATTRWSTPSPSTPATRSSATRSTRRSPSARWPASST